MNAGTWDTVDAPDYRSISDFISENEQQQALTLTDMGLIEVVAGTAKITHRFMTLFWLESGRGYK